MQNPPEPQGMGMSSLHQEQGEENKINPCPDVCGIREHRPRPGDQCRGEALPAQEAAGARCRTVIFPEFPTLRPADKGMFVSRAHCVLPSRTIKRKTLTMGNCASSSLCAPRGGVGGKKKKRRKREETVTGQGARAQPAPWERASRARRATGLPGHRPPQDGDREGAGWEHLLATSRVPVSLCHLFPGASWHSSGLPRALGPTMGCL